MPKKLTQEYVDRYCLERGYRVMNKYINNSTKIKLENIETSVTGEMKFGNFQQGQRFDNPNSKVKLTQEYVSEYCESHGYYLNSQYVNNCTKIKLENIKIGGIGWQSFHSFKQGYRYDTKKLTYQEYVQPFTNEGYIVLIDEEEYKDINTKTKIKVSCPNGHEWSVKRDNFTQHRRCPMCNQEKLGGMSHGERLIYSILSGNNIDFEREYSVRINGNLHKFDFYLELNNKKYFIEYDGKQHFKDSTGYLVGKLSKQQRKDRIKDQYALDNSIIMVRIPYTENTVSKVVRMINNKMGLDLHKVKVNAPKKQEVLDYYLNNGRKETVDRFMIDFTTICRYAQDIWGMSKEKYLIKIGRKAEKKEITDYYLEHNLKETVGEFRINCETIRRYFKREYGMSKTEYLKTLDK